MIYPKPLHWTAGQLLDPQHFQETDRVTAHRVAQAIALCRPRFWGLIDIRVNMTSLAEGVFLPDRMELIFPDGARAVWTGKSGDPEGNAVVRPLSLKEADIPEGGKLAIHAALDPLRPANNAAPYFPKKPDEQQASCRFHAVRDATPTADAFSFPHATRALDDCVLTRLHYNIRLLAGDGAGGESVRVPVARLVKQDGAFVPDPGFMPPLAAVAASPGLIARLERLMLRLEEFVRDPVREGGDRAAAAEAMLRTVSARLRTELSSLRESVSGTPESAAWACAGGWDLYRVLKAACAETLAFLRPNDLFARLDAIRYVHADPAGSLGALLDMMNDALDSVLPEAVMRLRPVVDNGLMTFSLPDAVLDKTLSLYLAIKSAEPVQTLLLEGRLLAGEPDDVRRALGLALSELPLKPIAPPRGLPVGAGEFVLKPNCSGEPWEKVLRKRLLAVAYYPVPKKPVEELAETTRLYFVRGGGA